MDRTANDQAKLAVFLTNYKKFKKELAEALGVVELTARDLADITGLSIDAIRQYDGGKRRAELDAAEVLARAFGRPVEDLSNPKPPDRPEAKKRRWVVVSPRVIGEAPPKMLDELRRVIAKHSTAPAVPPVPPVPPKREKR